MNIHWKVLGLFGAILALLVIAYISFGIPIACGSHGCIRETDFTQHYRYTSAFARYTNVVMPTQQEILTTLMRRYLLIHTPLASSVSLNDAAQYRTDVLQIIDPVKIQELGYFSLAQYDELVLVPLLIQEILMSNRHLNSPSELYQQLAQEQWLFLFRAGYSWDKTTGTVVAK